MAGIGFELKKLFDDSEDTPFGSAKALLFSTAVSIGPWFITATSLNLILLISKTIDLSRNNQILFMSTIFYIFIFSQIVTNAFQYLVTRYVSDCIFNKKIFKIKSAYIGCIKLVTIISFLLSTFFIKKATLSVGYKISFVVLFVSMSLSWITMIFISLLKKYKFILFCFFLGNFISVILGYVFLKYPVTFIKEDPTFWMLFSYTVGIFLNFIMTSMYIMRAFPGKEKNQFEFFVYFRGYFSLIMIGTLYILGVWGHVFVNWFVGDSYILANVFLVSPVYEAAVFYGYCTVIPSLVYFATFLETKFLPLYKDYFNKLCVVGKYEDVKESLKTLKHTLISEVLYCMELQLLISITCILIANIMFNELDMDTYLLDLFRVIVFGSYSSIFISILITLFLYFDLRFQAMVLALSMFITGILFSYIFGKMGMSFTGFGFFLSSLLTFAAGVYMFYKLFDKLNYTIMFRQNFNYKVGGSFVKKVSQLFNNRIYIVILIIILFLLGSAKAHAAYDSRGFNNVTGNNRDTMSPYDKEGYDINGYNRQGADRRGFNKVYWNIGTNSPYDYSGFDYKGIHKDTGKEYDARGFNYEHFNGETNSKYDKNGFTFEGIHKDTGREYDKNGWNYYGLNEQTKDYFNKEGWNFKGINRRGFNKDKYNVETNSEYDGWGFNYDGINKDTGKEYDTRGFNYKHFNVETNSKYDKNGFTYDGINKDTGREYDKNGWNYYGLNEKTQDYYDETGWTFDGINRQGFNREGYNVWTKSKYDYANFDFQGINKNTKTRYDERGFDNNQIHSKTHTKYDERGFDYGGKHKDTGTEYDKDGWNFYGLNEKTKTYFDSNGYTREGLDKYGYKKGQRPKNFGVVPAVNRTRNSAAGTKRSGAKSSSGSGGYDKNGFDKNGIYRRGY
ncbi:exopolysaccharide Pel transporter PelG [uncultured Leptotrichia sp.]|jgi:hypothetical protein|uniref:exopolysaccharide Pel transporter PelG n=1 Tax=uncultured Leptotrichia sp. TaxID=159271 RepID=UPI0026137E39|nr:exopolysaccharide Pel transporter PelG [uncultured Leptotrichia sp.]